MKFQLPCISLPMLGTCLFFSFLNNDHPNGWEVVTHGVFDLQLSSNYWHWISFCFLIGLCTLIGKVFIPVLCWFFNWNVFLLVKSSLHILDNRPPPDILVENIFSHPLTSLFTSLMMPFDVQSFVISKSLAYLTLLLLLLLLESC